MAMSHVQPMLLLLASLFFLPVLRGAIDFEYCDENGNDYGNVTRIEVSPSINPYDFPYITIKLLCSASTNIFSRTVVYVGVKSADYTDHFKTYDLCDVGTCNTESKIEAGTNFELTLPEVPYVEGIKYSVYLRERIYHEPIMCVDFNVPAFALVSPPASAPAIVELADEKVFPSL